jgi:hypothetical protein
MYGTRTALFMDVTTPKVCVTSYPSTAFEVVVMKSTPGKLGREILLVGARTNQQGSVRGDKTLSRATTGA